MSQYHRNGDTCPTCGITYKSLKTGLTYCAVFSLLLDAHSDSSFWRYKRRHTVLGKWHEIKRDLWRYHTDIECPSQKEYERQQGDETGAGADDHRPGVECLDVPF